MSRWSDNPVADFNSHCDEEERWLMRRPKCDYCEEHIQDDTYFEINDEKICKECMNFYFRKYVED